MKDHADRGTRSLSVKPTELVAREPETVVGKGERAQPFPKFDERTSITLAHLFVHSQEPLGDEPAAGTARRLQLIRLVFDIDRVQELPDQLEPAWGNAHLRALVVAV